MANSTLFSSVTNIKPTNTINEASGDAYAFSPSHALAQYAATGTFHQTYYADAEAQLSKVLELCNQVPTEMIAKTAIYCRERGFMKDMPAFLTACLATKDTKLLSTVFPKVIDNGKMLRNFVQMVRSGVCGRKSFGSAPKRLVQQWFSSRTVDQIFRQSIGNNPSMADIIKMIRPSPTLENGQIDVQREALYGYLIGKNVDVQKLPLLVQAFETYKREKKSVPEVPFEMLTALDLNKNEWTEIAKNMNWTQTRMNLNTLLRHDVFKNNPKIVHLIAERLADPKLIRQARVFPYQLLAAYKATSSEMPIEITNALQQAMEIAIENTPKYTGKIYLCPDVSGSMHSPVTGYRKGATSTVQCIDIAALVSAAFLRRNWNSEVIPFSDDVVPLKRKLNPADSVMSNAKFLSKLPSGGTACSAPLKHLNMQKAKGDVVIFISDNMSWADFSPRKSGTAMAQEWESFKDRNQDAKLVLIDIQPNSSTQVSDDESVLNIGGFSDSVFEIISLFIQGELSANHWIGQIEAIQL